MPSAIKFWSLPTYFSCLSTSLVIFKQHFDTFSSSGPKPYPYEMAKAGVPPVSSSVSPEGPNPPKGLATQGNFLPLTFFGLYLSKMLMVDASTQTCGQFLVSLRILFL